MIKHFAYSSNPLPLRVLSANVGNSNWCCKWRYNNKLCENSVENTISKNVQKLKPDIVFFQELLHPSQCMGWRENNPRKVCYYREQQVDKFQPRRLLGSDYSIACFTRVRSSSDHPVGLDCIAVHNDTGVIDGCPPGDLCVNEGRMDAPGDGCNPEFVVASVVASLLGIKVILVNAHPHSVDKSCRLSAIRQIFEGNHNSSPLAGDKYSIIAGDFNFDPFRERGELKEVWDRYVGDYGSGKPYYYHSGPSEHKPPYPTSKLIWRARTVDHVISNFLRGTCVTLSGNQNSNRIDGGRGMDHRAVFGDLWMPKLNPIIE